jgi:hypothetical protein
VQLTSLPKLLTSYDSSPVPGYRYVFAFENGNVLRWFVVEAKELLLLFIEQTPDECRPSYEPSRRSLVEPFSELDVCTSECARESEDVTNVDEDRGDSLGKVSVI